MKHLLKLGGLTPEEITHILDVADEYKRLHRDGIDPKDLQGKAVALIFAKNSTRTRASLEVGIYQMGGLGTYLSANDLQTARGEPVQDTARVLGRYYDAIVCRTYKQTTLDALAKYSGISVISGMTDYAHPLQVLTDLMTVRERKGTLAGLKAGFIGDGYNMANSVIVGCLAMGMAVAVACPKHYRPAADVLMLAQRYGDKFIKWLFRLWSRYQSSLYNNRCAYIQFGNLSKIVHCIMVNDLKGLKICSIMENNKSKGLGITNASYPATYGDLLIQVFIPFSVNLFYCCKFHN